MLVFHPANFGLPMPLVLELDRGMRQTDGRTDTVHYFIMPFPADLTCVVDNLEVSQGHRQQIVTVVNTWTTCSTLRWLLMIVASVTCRQLFRFHQRWKRSKYFNN